MLKEHEDNIVQMKQLEDMTGSGIGTAASPVIGAQPIDPPAEAPRKKKICILGTAPQWQMAPFDDPSWEIWGIFGVSLVNKRLTRLYEIHDKAIIDQMVAAHSPDGRYWKVAGALGANFITKDAFPQCPESTRYDFDAKIKKYGKYFASSGAWLLADAIDQDPEEISILGINMAADEEYAHQKPSMTYLIGWARAAGIKITTPLSSELLTLTHQYGLEQPPRFHAAMAQRKLELNGQLGAHKQNLLNAQLSIASIEGALNQLAYFEQNWKA